MKDALDRRRAGALLHPSSLPGPGYCGDLGANARRFIDLLAAAGLGIWQVLPLGPTHSDRCPYQAFSVHAGNPDLIDLEWLVEQGWLEREEAERGQQDSTAKRGALSLASDEFFSRASAEPDASMVVAYRKFLRAAHFWLEDYVRFQAFRDDFAQTPWTSWPDGLRNCDPRACDDKAAQLADKLDTLRFRQFAFHCQWHALHQYANAKGILLFGDMPIYVHLESADVWAHQHLFDLDSEGHPLTVTGVPPDYFSAEGQLWGNPQYDWNTMRQDGFHWWLQRFATAGHEFDIIRIDHFRALQAYWEIPADAVNARGGRWVEAPGQELLRAVRATYPELCLVAENLGTIGPEVEALRAEFELPGMLILQFAFDGNPDNPYLNHRHTRGDIVYTGTHDNDTTRGWFDSLDPDLRQRVYDYYGAPNESMPWMLIAQAMVSRANTVIIPWQDFLALDGNSRMNTPGTTQGNWHWRFAWDQVPQGLEARIINLLQRTERSEPMPCSKQPG